MLNSFIKNISPVTKLLCLVLLIIALIIAKSIYLVLFISTLVFIIVLISNISVNTYIKFAKNIYFILLILLVLYIIILREFNILNIVLIIYKTIVGLILIKTYEEYVNFNELHSSIYQLMPLKKYAYKKVSYDFTLSLYFVKFIIESKEEIKKIQLLNGEKSFSIKHFLKPRLIYSINKLVNLSLSKKANHYTLINKKSDFKSKLVLIVFLMFFVLCIFKEVIL